MHRWLRDALAPLALLAVLAAGCSQDDVDKVVAASRDRAPAQAPAGSRSPSACPC
jgi:hypothetical protein